jgi:DegV family protein with EDD domain
VLYAAELAEKGMSAKEIVAQVESIKGKVRASFVIDTMDYLYRGGRCSGLAAMLGSALNIHPRIAVKNGSMHPEQRYRGREAKFVMDYVRDMEVEVRTARPERVFITHSHCNPTIVAKVRRFLENTNHFKEIDETFAGAVVSSHCGPGTLGVLFIED